MSASYAERPMRAVFGPSDAEDVRRHLHNQRGLMASLLLAKDAVLSSLQGAGSRASELIDRLHVGWALVAARRLLGWASGSLSAGGRLLRTPGVRSGLTWAVFTSGGQRLLGSGMKFVGAGLRGLARLALTGVPSLLRWFGAPGLQVAATVENVSHALEIKAWAQVKAASAFAGDLLQPAGPIAQGIASVAKAKTLSTLLSRVLPGSWAVTGRVAAWLISMPSWVRSELISAIRGFLKSAAAAGTVANDAEPRPEDDPTPPAPLVAIKAAAEPDVEPQAVGQVHPSLGRYPAKRSPNAKKRR